MWTRCDVGGRAATLVGEEAFRAAPSFSTPSPQAYLVGVQGHVDVGDAVQVGLDKGLDASRVFVSAWHCQGAALVEVDLEKAREEGRRAALVGEGERWWWLSTLLHRTCGSMMSNAKGVVFSLPSSMLGWLVVSVFW